MKQTNPKPITWITNGTAKPFYARSEFALTRPVRSATASVCGLGQFLFYLNGKKVGDHELDPGWTDYRKYVQYVTFDVTGYLREGTNAIGAEVGNGWYCMELEDGHYSFRFPGFMPPNPNPYRPFDDHLILAVTLELTYDDGTCETIVADESWRVAEHAVRSSNVYGSELIDGRHIPAGWAAADFDDSGWAPADLAQPPQGTLSLQTQPPIRVIHSYEAVCLHTVHDRDIYDLGQNISGILEFEVKGHAGDTIRIYPAEKLNEEGDVDQMAKNWTLIDSCVTYIIGSDDCWETCRMKFAYFAGRYLAVEGAVPEDAGSGRPTTRQTGAQIRRLTGHAITSAHQTDGTFSCDDARYEQIYALVERAVEANMLSVHTDCPTIERFAWQEPNHLMAPSIFYMKNGKALWEKFLKDMRVAQHTATDVFADFEGNDFYPGDGLVPSQAPCYIPNVLPVPGMGSFYDIIPWGSSCILGAYWHYLFYGDLSVIRDNYETASATCITCRRK